MTSVQGKTGMPVAVVMNVFHTSLGIAHSLRGIPVIGFDLLVQESSQTEETANDFIDGSRRRGVHLAVGNGVPSFRIMPELTISGAEIDKMIDVMDQALSELGTGKAEKREDWPKNPSTGRLFENHPVKRVTSGLWRSAPEDWLNEARE
jgi:hypothetical protein